MKFFGSVFFVAITALKLFSLETYLLNPTVYEQESATVVIHVKGKEVKLPKVQEIEGLPVVDRGGRQSTQMINGETIKEFYYELTFYPKHSMIIPAFEIIVDGKKEYTEPFELALQKNPHTNFSVETTISNPEPLQNEVIKLQLRFKCKDTLGVQDIKITQPDLSDFWVQSLEYVPTYSEGDFVVHGMNYYIYARHSGTLVIPPIKVDATQQVLDQSTSYPKTHSRSFESKALSLHVKPLDNGMTLVGDFILRTSVDKKEIVGNEMLYVSIKITGEGNFADIEPFKLLLDDAIVFNNESKIRTYMQNEKRQWEYIQRFPIGNAQRDFTIPSFALTFYDPLTNSLKTTQSDPITIHTHNPFVAESFRGGKEEKQNEQRNHDEDKKDQKGFHVNSISIVIGFLLGIVFVIGVQFLSRKKKSLKIPYYTTHKSLLQKLLLHKGQNNRIDILIKALEGNLYHKENHPISKKEIKAVLKSIAQKEHFSI